MIGHLGGQNMHQHLIGRVVGLALGAGLLLGATSRVDAAPRWIRLSWTQAPATSLTVTWNDDGAAGQAEIRPINGTATTIPSTAVTTSVSEFDYTHVATFTGLQPDTPYEYRVESQATWSGWQATRTAPAPGDCTPFTFVAVGDGRGEDIFLLGYSQSGQWTGVMGHIVGENPLFVLHSGDYVHDGVEIDQWVTELDTLPTISALFPFFMAQGNHDDGPGEGASAHYNMIFSYPDVNPDNAEDYYSLIMGNVQVICLSTHSFDMVDQINWMDAELTAQAGTVDWRVVFFHVPIWSSGAHGSNENDTPRADLMLPVLESHGVDLVINGHDHDYERFHPSYGGHNAGPRVVNPLPFDSNTRGEADGVIYIVSGGGGALLNPLFAVSEQGSAVGSNNLNYAVIRVEGDTLRVTTRDLGPCLAGLCGSPSIVGDLDDIILEKSNTGCVIPGPDAGVPDAGVPDAGVPDAGLDDAGAQADAATPPADASPGVDGGGDPVDGGGDPVDGGGDPVDASTTTSDSGAPPPASPDPGCSCRTSGSAGSAGLALLLLLFGWLRRRRRCPMTNLDIHVVDPWIHVDPRRAPGRPAHRHLVGIAPESRDIASRHDSCGTGAKCKKEQGAP
jgi:MYXO-CTERM domain-containing protein